jgi:hypothetical protein
MEFLAGNRIRGTTAEKDTLQAVTGGWKELDRTTTVSAGNSYTVSGLADKRYLMILTSYTANGSLNGGMRLNGDTGNNYYRRSEDDGGTSTASTNSSLSDVWGYGGSHENGFQVSYIANKSDKEKLVIIRHASTGSTGSGNTNYQIPSMRWSTEKYVPADLADSVSSATIGSFYAGAGSFDSGSEIVVLGWDPADTHTDNFWEPLADVELSGSNASLSSGTITAKKYLWVQYYIGDRPETNYDQMIFNSDGGTNYNQREIRNETSSGTRYNNSSIYSVPETNPSTSPTFFNGFIVNRSNKEKLLTAQCFAQNTAGVNAPSERYVIAGKWANTSNQITNITVNAKLVNGNNSTFPSGSFIKVWGHD